MAERLSTAGYTFNDYGQGLFCEYVVLMTSQIERLGNQIDLITINFNPSLFVFVFIFNFFF